MRLALAQLNSTVGDFSRNISRATLFIDQAHKESCDLVVFPEMALPGYPAEDLLLKPSFIKANLVALHSLAKTIQTIPTVIGFIDYIDGHLFNAAAWIEKGKIRHIYHKQKLPNYGVFDEQRYFWSGNAAVTLIYQGIRIGLTICEDIWTKDIALAQLKKQKPDIILNLSASPFHIGKMSRRFSVAKKTARYLNAAVFYCNMVGAQDELVFDGGSFCAHASGKIMGPGKRFGETMVSFDVNVKKSHTKITMSSQREEKLSPIAEIYEALVLGLRDYVSKNGFNHVALGVSGGIDSAVVASLAVRALGPERVIGVTMPSRFNSKDTLADSHQLAKNLGIKLYSLPIESCFTELINTLAPIFLDRKPDVTEENIQARIRGNLLMALSNKFGWLILTTGNKSELSTGYCTLYGDTAGGFALIKDVLKTTVYELANFLNQQSMPLELIPNSIIQRPPTAELRDNQKDEDSLGSYADLDKIIIGYVEKNYSIDRIIKETNLAANYVNRITKLIDRNEYKRRQAPLGVKITERSFGRDHRMPITNRFNQ